MGFLSFFPLVGSIVLFLVFSTATAKPSSFSVDIRGSGVMFLDGPLTADNIGVFTLNNNVYSTDINLGGINLTVNLDTGSIDLVVLKPGLPFEFTNTTTLQTNESFGIGATTGTVQFADLQIGDLVIPQQAFFDATQVQDLGASGDGILGISFNVQSPVITALAQAVGDDAAQQVGATPMINLFTHQPDLPDSFDVLLTRADELGDVAQGTFLIGAHDDNFQNVADAPQLTSVSNEHWSVVLDAMNVNGQAFQFNASRVQGVPAGKVAAVLDTGFSFPPLPPPAVDAIYSSIPGAVFSQTQGLWIVPCNETTQLSFVFGGTEFPVHPLDLTATSEGAFDPANPGVNVTVCVNRFQYLTLDPSEFTGFDLILGDAFLRNAYASFNYGDVNTAPFVQMVPTTTDPTQALQEFQAQRAASLAKLPPTLDGQGAQFPADDANGPASSTAASSPGQPSASTTATAQNSTPSVTNKLNNGGGRNVAEWLGVVALLSGAFLL